MDFRRTLLACLLLSLSVSAGAQASPANRPLGAAAQQVPSYLQHAKVEQRLGNQLPMNTQWTDETGRSGALSTWFDGKPVVFAEVYYKCKLLCPQVLNGLAASLKQTTLKPGKDYEVLAFSIDPTDTPAASVLQKQEFLNWAGWANDPQAANAVHFLTGPENSIEAVSSASGFHFVRVPGPDGKMDQFAHSSVIMFATPEGRVSRYLAGIDYGPRDVRMALLDASQKRISNPVDLLILYCCNYVPSSGRYTVSILRVLGLAAVASLAALVAMLFLLTRKPKAHAQ